VIKFNCENCGQEFEVSDQNAGQKGICPKCQEPIVIPPAEQGPGEVSAIIKFRCPTCNQKIGVRPDYAGKRVRCTKCGNPIRVPEVPAQSGHSAVKDETSLLKDKQEPGAQDLGPDRGMVDELLSFEANAPSVERQIASGELPESAAFAEKEVSRDRPNKKRLIIFIGVAVLVLSLVGIVAWSFVSDADSGESEMEAKLGQVQGFAEDYIGLLSAGRIEEAIELLSPELQTDVENGEIERLAQQFDESDIVGLECRQTSPEEPPQAEQFYLCYNFHHEDEGQPIILSVSQIDEKLRIEGIAAIEPSGEEVSIGPHSFAELQARALVVEITEFAPILTKFFCGIVVVILVVGLIQMVSMWIVFDKAGQPGWAAIVPIYNMWVLAELGDKPGWWGLAMCFSGGIPFIGPIVVLVLSFMIYIGVAQAFGRGIIFGIAMALLPFVFLPILAFSGD